MKLRCLILLCAVAASFAASLVSAAEIHDAAEGGDTAKVVALIKQTPARVGEKDPRGNQPLHLAAQNGWTEIIGALLDAGADVNAKGFDDWTPLHFAAKGGSVGACRLLLQRHADRDALNRFQQKPEQLAGRFAAAVFREFVPGAADLFEAVEAGNEAKVQPLIAAAPAALQARNREGRTPLILAAAKDRLAIMKALLEAGADVNAADRAGLPALHYACEASDLEAVKLLFRFKVAPPAGGGFASQLMLASLHVDPAALKELEGKTPDALALVRQAMTGALAATPGELDATTKIREYYQLIKAAPEFVRKRMEIAALLIEHGADPNAVGEGGGTALRFAASNADTEGIALLLKHGAKPDSGSALTAAVLAGRPENLRVLLEAGADPLAATAGTVSALEAACTLGDVAMARQLLAAMKDRSRLPANSALLVSAARSGRPEIVALLLGSGVRVTSDRGKTTALHYAVTMDSPEVTRALIEAGADVNAQDKAGFAPLHNAAEHRKPQHVSILLKHGAKTELATDGGQTPLIIAAKAGDVEIMKLLLKAGAKVGAVTDNGLTALHHAAYGGHPEAVQVLLEAGAPADERARKAGVTPLAFASAGSAALRKTNPAGDGMPPLALGTDADYAATAALLIKAGANVNSVEEEQGFTPLHAAATYGQVNIVRMLLEKGAKVNTRSRDGRTPLHLAAGGDAPEIVTLLLDQKAAIDAVQDGHPGKPTPLMYAVQFGKVDNLKRLLQRGASIKTTYYGVGATALHVAAQMDQVEVAKILLEAGIKIDARDQYQMTPLIGAVTAGHRRVAEFLIEQGADVNAKMVRDMTALKTATARGDSAIAALLKAHGAKE